MWWGGRRPNATPDTLRHKAAPRPRQCQRMCVYVNQCMLYVSVYVSVYVSSCGRWHVLGPQLITEGRRRPYPNSNVSACMYAGGVPPDKLLPKAALPAHNHVSVCVCVWAVASVGAPMDNSVELWVMDGVEGGAEGHHSRTIAAEGRSPPAIM